MAYSLLLSHPPLLLAFSRLPGGSLQFRGSVEAVTCGSEHVFLLAYIKHLAVSSRRALKASMCSLRGEVTIQESCFLKGFCKTMVSWEDVREQRNVIKG